MNFYFNLLKKSLFLFIVYLLCSSLMGNATKKTKKTKKIIIAHRALSGRLPEHTLEAVAMAHAYNPNFMEPDCVLTKDGIPIVLHDIYLESTTNVRSLFPTRKREDGHYYALDFTLAELKTLRAHERINLKTNTNVFPLRFPHNQGSFKIPTLAEYIEFLQGLNKSTQRSVGLYLELKKPAFHLQEGYDITKIIYEVLQKYQYHKNPHLIYLQCFEEKTLRRLKEEFQTKIPLIQLVYWKKRTLLKKEELDSYLQTVSTYAQGVGPNYHSLFTNSQEVLQGEKPNLNDFVFLAHNYDLQVHPYTLRRETLPPYFFTLKDFASFLFEQGKVDGLFTDFVDLL